MGAAGVAFVSRSWDGVSTNHASCPERSALHATPVAVRDAPLGLLKPPTGFIPLYREKFSLCRGIDWAGAGA